MLLNPQKACAFLFFFCAADHCVSIKSVAVVLTPLQMVIRSHNGPEWERGLLVGPRRSCPAEGPDNGGSQSLEVCLSVFLSVIIFLPARHNGERRNSSVVIETGSIFLWGIRRSIYRVTTRDEDGELIGGRRLARKRSC